MKFTIRLFLIISISLILSMLAPLPSHSETPWNDLNGGWHEALIVTRDMKEMEKFFDQVAGWNRVEKGKLDKDTLGYLLGEDYANQSGRFVIMKSPDFDQGWVRIIQLNNTNQKIIRSNAQAWDTGGIFSIMTRSANIQKNLEDAEKLGWLAYNDPYDFGFGELKLRNIVLRGPDGVNIAIYEWVQPKREDARRVGTFSKAFNSMQMVSDIDTARTFYQDVLGFDLIQAGAFLDKEEKPTNFALPVNFATSIERDYAILIPQGANRDAGRVELMHFRGFNGRDLSQRASLSNFGITTLMFPVDDLSKLHNDLIEKNVSLYRGPSNITLQPWGKARALTVKSPDGALLTFFETIKK